MLEFKKKTRAHKWRNYAVYGLLTLSQLSKTGLTLELKLVNKNCRFILKKIFIFFKIQDMLSYLPHFVVYFSLAYIMIDFFLPKYIMDIQLRKRSTKDGISKRILFG